MKKRKKYRAFTWTLLAVLAIGAGVYVYYDIQRSIPDEIHYCRDEERSIGDYIDYPLVTYSEDTEVSGNGSFILECKLCGIIPIKNIKVEKTDRPTVYVSGDSVGIYMETQGVMIVDAGELQTMDGQMVKPAEHIVKAGDYIEKIDGKELEDKDDLIDYVAESDGSAMVLSVVRAGEVIDLKITPVMTEDGTYKLGLWVRDNVQGIGTLTYVTQDGQYGALGHGVSDADTGELLKIETGDLYQAEIIDVMKGVAGNPGELRGVIRYQNSNILGEIERNSKLGIYGTMSRAAMNKLDLTDYEIAMKQEIQEGPATVLCSIDGERKEYQAVIQNIQLGRTDTNKCFEVQITDSQLLEKTGGIVQGM